jgi:hypothetical protein
MGLESSIYRLKNKIIISLFQNKNVKFFYFNFKFLLKKIKYILFFEILIICFKIIKIFGSSNYNFKICELFYDVYLWEPDKNFF